ncbi:DUF998 domain-containing protein [Thermogladius calderae]|uniref:DUF998 domain-containing protein n=1 Tax=Thermogladius calderae TaxID=1200300 RepID=UPI001389C701|nr:DUF998 domain-containing protein [Thermogladius calderae]
MSSVEARPLILVSPFIASLLSLLLLALCTPWFNIWENAFSDLGRIEKGLTAVVFNGLVSTTGAILLVYATSVARPLAAPYRALLVLGGYSLTMIGVYPEDYGRLHFYVSLAFFLASIAYMVVHAMETSVEGAVIAALGLVNLGVWTAHFTFNFPPGAAVPELVSLVSMLATLARDLGKTDSGQS